MPHQCTECSHVFPDGSKAMLSGCPDCGGNTFQFLPEGALRDDEAANTSGDGSRSDGSAARGDSTPEPVPVESAEPVGASDTSEATDTSGAAHATEATDPPERPPPRGPVSRATAAVRDWVRVDPSSPSPRSESPRADPNENHETEVEPGTEAGREREPNDAADPPIGSTETTDPDADTTSDAGTETDIDDGTDADDGPDETDGIDEGNGANEADGTDQGNADNRTGVGSEDRAQAEARRDVVAAEEFPSDESRSDETDGPTPPGAEGGRVAAAPSGDRPDLDELRQELNDQFESIRIVAPGQYELNLMELYNREEYIIALREDGRYAIEAPETWLGRRADRD